MTSLNQFNYLDLKVLISELIGSPVLFSLLVMVAVVWLAIKFNVPTKSTIGLVVVSIFAVLSIYYSAVWVVALVILLGYIIYLGGHGVIWGR